MPRTKSNLAKILFQKETQIPCSWIQFWVHLFGPFWAIGLLGISKVAKIDPTLGPGARYRTIGFYTLLLDAVLGPLFGPFWAIGLLWSPNSGKNQPKTGSGGKV